jgi:hypothetical protein
MYARENTKSTQGFWNQRKADTANWRTDPDNEWTSVTHTKSKAPAKEEPRYKTSSYTKTNKSVPHSSTGDIKVWAKSKKTAVEMLSSGKVTEWMSSSSEAKNRLNMIKELAKNLRHDVLSLLIKRNAKFSANLPLKGFTPLQHVAYPGSSAAKTAHFEDLRATAQVLIEDYGFRLFAVGEDESEGKESVYGALLAAENPLSESLRMEFYQYLSDSAPMDWYIPNFRGYLNKLSNTTAEQFHNKLLMVACRFPEKIASVIFEQFMSARAPRIELLSQVQLVCNALLTAPNTVDAEMSPFFAKVDVHAKVSKMVEEFITKGHQWVAEEASKLEEGSEEHTDRIGLNTRIYYAVLGSMYHLGYAKKEILAIIAGQIWSHTRPIWLVRAVAMFLVHARIGVSTQDPEEKELLCSFISNCYNTARVKDKMDIEMGLNVNAKQIMSLVVSEAPVQIAPKVVQKEDEVDWDAMLATVGDEIAEDD